MMKAFLFLVLAALAAGAASAEVDCQQLYREHLESDLTLSYEAFDQTMGSGFRELSAQGCEREAADLIEAYIEATGAEQNSLRWHIAQLRASHGDYEQAVRYARSSLLENEDLSARPLRWNMSWPRSPFWRRTGKHCSAIAIGSPKAWTNTEAMR